MGFSVSWLAFKGATADEVCAGMGFERTGKFAELLSADLMGAELPNSMYLVLVDGRGANDGLGEQYMSKPTMPNEVLHFMCFDTAMVTLLECGAEGRKRWSIMRYEPSEPYALEGEIPAEYHRLLAKAKEEQKEDRGGDVDYLYEVTADLGKHLTGFRHDIVDDSIRFEVLTVRPFTPFEPKQSSPQHSSRRTGSAHPASGKPWWKFW